MMMMPKMQFERLVVTHNHYINIILNVKSARRLITKDMLDMLQTYRTRELKECYTIVDASVEAIDI